jgi:3'-phosphoadenosine 5'-phosphosulfate sulfotransferase (PAPS reductase)/FAD synthetase
LKDLSFRKNITILDLPITGDHLHNDGMHVHVKHLSMFYNTIQQYFQDLIPHQTKPPQSKRRSREAITRRNKQRHQKLKTRQAAQTVIRPIARVWKLRDLKDYLKFKNIKYSRLPEIHNHQLCIQFNHLVHQQEAEKILNFQDFDETSYYNWLSHEH